MFCFSCGGDRDREYPQLIPGEKDRKRDDHAPQVSSRNLETNMIANRVLPKTETINIDNNLNPRSNEILSKLTLLSSNPTPNSASKTANSTSKKEQSDDEVSATSQNLVIQGTVLLMEKQVLEAFKLDATQVKIEKEQYARALNLCKQALKIRVDRFGEFGKNNIKSLPYEISCYKAIIKAAEGLNNKEELFFYIQKNLQANIIYLGTENHADIARMVNSLGQLSLANQEVDNALKYFVKGAKIHSTIYGEEHPYIADNFMWIGITYTHLKKFEHAWICLCKSMLMREKIHGEEDSATKKTYHAVVELFNALEKAPQYQRKCTEILASCPIVEGELNMKLKEFCWGCVASLFNSKESSAIIENIQLLKF